MKLPIQAASVVRNPIGKRTTTAAATTPQDTCVTVSYNNGQICGDFPFIGQQCFSMSGLPSGSGSVKVCASYVFPDCAKLCVSLGSFQLGCITKCLF
jgi:hypothetical protein